VLKAIVNILIQVKNIIQMPLLIIIIIILLKRILGIMLLFFGDDDDATSDSQNNNNSDIDNDLYDNNYGVDNNYCSQLR